MKRTYLAKRNALLSSANLSWGAGALVFALLVLLLRLLAPNLFWQAFAPAFGASDALAVRGHTFLNSFADAAALAARNEGLVRENAALEVENQSLREKAASLEGLFGASGVPQSGGILAGVVARPPESPYDTLVLAAGTSAGVTLGMEAFGEGGVPLGAVSEVTADFSRVTLFSAPGMVTRGWIGKASLPADIFGAGGGAMEATLARSAGVAVSDVVYAPGPGQLPIGTVIRVDSDPSSPAAALRIAPLVNPFAVTWVVLRDTGAALRDAFYRATTTP